MIVPALDEIILRTAGRLAVHRQAGGCDNEFVHELIQEFVSAAREAPHGAGAVHMALSVYQMTVQAGHIKDLQWRCSQLEFALETMTDLQNL